MCLVCHSSPVKALNPDAWKKDGVMTALKPSDEKFGKGKGKGKGGGGKGKGKGGGSA